MLSWLLVTRHLVASGLALHDHGNPVWQYMFPKVFNFITHQIKTGYDSGTELSNFATTFASMETPVEPCNAQLLSMGLEQVAGFGSRVNGFVDELMIAIYGGYTMSLCDHVDSRHFVRDTWLQHFNLPAPLRICNSTLACATSPAFPGEGLSMLGRKLRHCMARPSTENRAYLLRGRSYIINQIFRLKGHTRLKVDRILQSRGISANEDYIGVHIRHGDKWTEAELIPTSSYGEVVTNFTQAPQQDKTVQASPQRLQQQHLHHGHANQGGGTAFLSAKIQRAVQAIREKAQVSLIRKVYVASDDPGAYRELQAQLGREFTVIRQPPVPSDIYRDRIYNDDDKILPILTDIVALQHASLFIGTASSNVGELVYYLRYGRDAVSLDDDGDMMGDHTVCPMKER